MKFSSKTSVARHNVAFQPSILVTGVVDYNCRVVLLLTAHPAWKLGMDVMSYYITYVGTPSNYLTMRRYKSTENTTTYRQGV